MKCPHDDCGLDVPKLSGYNGDESEVLRDLIQTVKTLHGDWRGAGNNHQPGERPTCWCCKVIIRAERRIQGANKFAWLDKK